MLEKNDILEKNQSVEKVRTSLVDLDVLASLVIGVCLFLVYSTPMQTVYYFADETSYLFRNPPLSRLIGDFWLRGFRFGRPITFFFYGLLGKAASQGIWGLQSIRILQYMVSLGVALLVYYLLRKRKVKPFWSAFLVLLIWSQPTFQVFHVYSMLTPYFLGIAASYLALMICFWYRRPGWLWAFVRFAVVVLLFLVGWLTFQATPFAALGLAGFYSLTSVEESATADRRRLSLYLVALGVSMLIFILGYRAALLNTDTSAYALAERSFAILGGDLSVQEFKEVLSPLNYLGPLEWWNYVLPIRKLSQNNFESIASISAFNVLACTTWSFGIEVRQAKRSYVISKYAIALGALLLTLLPLVADNFSNRQHIYIAVVPALVLLFAYCVGVIVGHYRLNTDDALWTRLAGIIFLAFLLFGAQANLYRGLVVPSARFVLLVETALIEQRDNPYEQVVVVTTKPTCTHEPCRGFFGRRTSIAHARGGFWGRFYANMMRTMGMRADVPIEFTSEISLEELDEKTLLIDHRPLHRYLKGSN